MKKFPLIALLTLTASPTVTMASPVKASHNFSYLAVGLQYTNLDNNVISSVYYDAGSYHNKFADNLAGLYFRGSWNFNGNLFAELRSDSVIRETLTLTHSLFGMGYYHPVSANFTLYGLAGLADKSTEQETQSYMNERAIHYEQEGNGLTGEIGARLMMNDQWSLEPSVRVANYNESLNEYRIGNIIQVSSHMNIEFNAQKRTTADINEVNYQLGARYTF